MLKIKSHHHATMNTKIAYSTIQVVAAKKFVHLYIITYGIKVYTFSRRTL